MVHPGAVLADEHEGGAVDIAGEVERAILTEIAPGAGQLDRDTNLLKTGTIDSMGIVKLILFMERSFGIQIDDEEVVPEHFETVNKIAAFAASKMK